MSKQIKSNNKSITPYSILQTGKLFDWNKELKKWDKKTKGMSGVDIHSLYAKDILKLELLAKDWVTCACGNQCSIIPRYFDGTPHDIFLAFFGKKFYNTLKEYQFSDCLIILDKIEKRSKELINELTENSIVYYE